MVDVLCKSEVGSGRQWVSAHSVATASEFLVVVTEGAVERAETFDTLEQAELYAVATGGQLYQRSAIETLEGVRPNYVAMSTKPTPPALLVVTRDEAFCVQLEPFDTEEQAELYAASVGGEVYRYDYSNHIGMAEYSSDATTLVCAWHAGKVRLQSIWRRPTHERH